MVHTGAGGRVTLGSGAGLLNANPLLLLGGFIALREVGEQQRWQTKKKWSLFLLHFSSLPLTELAMNLLFVNKKSINYFTKNFFPRIKSVKNLNFRA